MSKGLVIFIHRILTYSGGFYIGLRGPDDLVLVIMACIVWSAVFTVLGIELIDALYD